MMMLGEEKFPEKRKPDSKRPDSHDEWIYEASIHLTAKSL